MATSRPGFAALSAEFSVALLAELETQPRARMIARHVAETCSGSAVLVYTLRSGETREWVLQGSVGEASADTSRSSFQSGTLGSALAKRQPILFNASQLTREQYAHLDVRRTFASLAYIPLLAQRDVFAVIEIVSFDSPLPESVLAAAAETAPAAAAALAAAAAYEDERNISLQSISRLASLYDLERSFNSTLQMHHLLPIITSKVKDILEAEAVNLWLVEGDDLILLHRNGEDPTTSVGMMCPADGIASESIETGKALLCTKPSEPRLAKRNTTAGHDAIRTLMVVPIVHQKYAVGALEVVNRVDGRSYDEDGLFFLNTISLTAASALHNASLLEAERKIETLETLVEVSREITSTLNLDRVLQVLVNGPQKVMPYERAAVALEVHGRMQLKAISGRSEINTGDANVRRLAEMLDWAGATGEESYVTQHGNKIDAEREETRVKFQEYFEQSGSRAWFSIPLADDQGRLGVLSFESRNPDFLTDTHFEFAKVLASQATVALRNASLYTEVPFIGILEPLLQKKQQFLRLEKRRRMAMGVLAAATLLFLVFFPLPMRVVGDALIAAQNSAKVQAEVEGVVRRVYVREGDNVTRGTILADLDDWEYRAALAAAQAKFSAASAATNRALAESDSREAGIQRVQADYWAAEVARAKERLDRTRLVAPIDGTVATAHIENMIGRKLEVGDTLADLVNTVQAVVDVAVDESDVGLIQAGQNASVKVEGFPIEKFKGYVEVVSPVSGIDVDHRVFFARVRVPNPDGLLRPGMQGRSKISTGWRPAGFVLLRAPAMWAWNKIWSWIGW